MQTRQSSVTSGNSHDPHNSDNRRVDRNKSGPNLLQRNSDNWKQDNGDIQLIPPGKSTVDIPSVTLDPNKLQLIAEYCNKYA